jgi:hypothetical protein
MVYLPDSGDVDDDDPNTASIITILRYGSFKMLFGGDQTEEGWRKLLSDKQKAACVKGTCVYKVSHHGRDVGCSPELMEIISPTLRLCIISDKAIDVSSENTECVDWYRSHVSGDGCKVVDRDGSTEKRRVLTTRKDGSIHISVRRNGEWWCYKDTTWN